MNNDGMNNDGIKNASIKNASMENNKGGSDLRETRDCPCYRLVHTLRPEDSLPDHICRLTMRASCAQYLLDEKIAIPEEGGSFGPLRFSVGMGSCVEIERWDEWPWTIRNSAKSVVMVLRQSFEHRPSPSMTAVLRDRPEWAQAKASLHMALHLAALTFAVRQWQDENPEKDVPEDLIRAFEPPLMVFDGDIPEVSLSDQNVQNSLDDTGFRHHGESHSLLPQADLIPAWPTTTLAGPTGLSEDELRGQARTALQAHHLSSTDRAADLLLSEVLPAIGERPSAPRGLPNSLCVTSFLLGDWTPVFTASMVSQEEKSIQIMASIDPVGAATRRQALHNGEHFRLNRGGETTFSITGSSDWARTETIKEATKPVNAHKAWWARQATRDAINSDKRKVRGSRQLYDVDEDNVIEDEDDEMRDIRAYLAKEITKVQLRERAQQRAEEDGKTKLTPTGKAELNKSLDGRVRYQEDKTGVILRKKRLPKSA